MPCVLKMKRLVILIPLSLWFFPLRVGADSDWTILVYLNGDNDLYEYAVEDFNEMEVVGSNSNVNVVVQIDLPARSYFFHPPFTDTRRYYVERDPEGMNDRIVSEKLWPETGSVELDMGQPSTLAEFVIWGIDNFPASHYCLIIWDHGDGFRYPGGYQSAQVLKTLSSDMESGNSISVADGEVAEALGPVVAHLGRKLDLIGIDACLMGMWEVDYILRDFADYVVHSQETENATGFDFEAMLRFISLNPEVNSYELCYQIVVDSIDSVGSTLSCVELGAIESLSLAIDDFALSVMEHLERYEDEIAMVADRTMRFGEEDIADLAVFTTMIAQRDSLPEDLGEVAGRLAQRVTDAVVISETRGAYAGAGGISIYLPLYYSRYIPYDPVYANGDGALWADHLWDEMLCSFSDVICCVDEYEPDNSPAEAKEVGASDPVQKRNFFPSGDRDWLKAKVWKGMRYRFFTTGPMDTYMRIYDDEYNVIAEHDDISETNRNSSIEWEADYDGQIYIELQEWHTTVGLSGEIGPYSIEMRWQQQCSQQHVPVCLQEGVCFGTNRICSSDGWLCPYPESYRTTDRLCDGLDNDCDGQVDEDYVPYGCGVGECVQYSRCVGGEEVCEPLEPVVRVDVLCDGRDNDCDGEIDEDGECFRCDGEKKPECLSSGVCEAVVPVCVDGRWHCNYPDSYDEFFDGCDGVDNDCDGLVDEDCRFSAGGGQIGCSIVAVF